MDIETGKKRLFEELDLLLEKYGKIEYLGEDNKNYLPNLERLISNYINFNELIKRGVKIEDIDSIEISSRFGWDSKTMSIIIKPGSITKKSDIVILREEEFNPEPHNYFHEVSTILIKNNFLSYVENYKGLIIDGTDYFLKVILCDEKIWQYKTQFFSSDMEFAARLIYNVFSDFDLVSESDLDDYESDEEDE